MDKPNRQKETQFKPGQSGNPLGGKLHNQDLKRIRAMTTKEIEMMGTLLLDCNVRDLQNIIKDPASSSLKIVMASVLAKAIQNGDHKRMEALLSRTVGKLKEQVVLSNPEGDSFKLQNATDEALAQRVLELEARRKQIEGE